LLVGLFSLTRKREREKKTQTKTKTLNKTPPKKKKKEKQPTNQPQIGNPQFIIRVLVQAKKSKQNKTHDGFKGPVCSPQN
jgi:hypothetical protein